MNNLFDYISFLGLKKPVNLQIITKHNRAADAQYMPEYSDKTGKLKQHNITIWAKGNTRELNTLIAHELIHAWQEEKQKWETHGPYFIKYAKKMEKHFDLHEVYLPDVDEE